MTCLYFLKKIKCMKCGRKHKGKLYRSKRVYICSTHDNYKSCERRKVNEDELLLLLNMRYGEELSDDEIKTKVENVEVFDDRIIINVSDGKPIVSANTFAEF